MLTYSNAYALGFSRKKMLRISMKIQGVQQKLKKHVNFQGRGGTIQKIENFRGDGKFDWKST